LKERTEIKIKEVEKTMAAIQPQLIEAMIAQGNNHLADTLAKNLSAKRGGLDNLFSGGGFAEILATVKGSPLEKVLKDTLDLYNDSQKKGK
jgi:hypothetical protein